MAGGSILVLEPDAPTRKAVGGVIRRLRFRAHHSRSLEDALVHVRTAHVSAVVVDGRMLVQTKGSAPGFHVQTKGSAPSQHEYAGRMREAITELRQARQAWARGAGPRGGHRFTVIVTAEAEDPASDAATHAAAIRAGADVYLRAEDARQVEVLEAHLQRAQDTQVANPRVTEASLAAAPLLSPKELASPVLFIADAFALPDADLRAGKSGRWDAKRIARVLGVEFTALADALGVRYTTMVNTPASQALQPKLEPFAAVLAIVREVYADTDTQTRDERVRMWLALQQPELGTTAREAMLRPGAAPAVAQWVTRKWLGEGE